MKKKYHDINWVEDKRYVKESNTLTIAGQSAGFDGVLHLIAQQLGEPMAAMLNQQLQKI